MIYSDDTIIALATANGIGAIAVIRLSGKDAIKVTNRFFKGKDLEKASSHTVHFGTIRNEDDQILDEVLTTTFVAPNSYTRENTIEISCHGSQYIIQRIIELFLRNGVRYAKAGEYTQRAFFNGQLDLAQAEAVADLIASDSEASHKMAMNQMRGGFSQEIALLREKLVDFASLIELELDFGEEDVEFADRDALRDLLNELSTTITRLIQSFQLGNAIKNGIPTVIAGKPNAGKSTLLNALLNEEKAIVSSIAGTTRDFIEDEITIKGITFRFTDTAGLREDTRDEIEAIGVQRTYEKMKKASLIIYLFDAATESASELGKEINKLENQGVPFLLVANKTDLTNGVLPMDFEGFDNILSISANDKINIEALQNKIAEIIHLENFDASDTVVTNARHYDSLTQTLAAIEDVINGLDAGVTGDFIAMDIRQSLHHLGEITGQITTDDLLANIFSNFCIGK